MAVGSGKANAGGGAAGGARPPVQSKLGAQAAASVGPAAVTGVVTPPAVQGAISLNPNTFTQGGFLDDVDVVIADAAFLLWDYDGKSPETVPALGITFHQLNDTANPPTDHDQYYSCGKQADFVPTPDGSSLLPVGSKKGLGSQTNGGLFIAALMNIGVPPETLDSGNVKALIGMQLHVNQVPAPVFAGSKPREDGRPKTIVLPTALLAMPGEQQGPSRAAGQVGTGQQSPSRPATQTSAPATKVTQSTTTQAAAAGPTPGAQTTASPSDPELHKLATDVLLELLVENGGTMPRAKIGPQVYNKLKDHPRKTDAMKLAFSPEFLEAGTAWSFDGANVAMV